jgi:hypothetical protein
MSLGKDLIAVGTSDAATRLLLALGFARAGPLQCLTIRVEKLLWPSFAFGALSRRLQGTPRFVRGLLDAPRALLRRSLDPALRRMLVRLPGTLSREACSGVQVSSTQRVESPQAGKPLTPKPVLRFVRDSAIVNWMIAWPWIVEDGARQADYAFSSRRDTFRYLPYELRGGASGENLGYVVLLVSSQERRTTMKILDHALRDDRLRACAFGIALREAVLCSADVLECSDEWHDLVAASATLRSVAVRSERTYLVHTRDPEGPLGARRSELAVGYCDGEAPYT